MSIAIASLVLGQAAAPAAPAIQINPVRTMHQFRALAYAPAPVGRTVAASLEGNTVRIFDAEDGQIRRELTGHPQPVYGLAFDRTGRRLATGDESGRIWIWDVASGRRLVEFDRVRAHVRGIAHLSFNDDGTRLASTGKDDLVIIWNPATGRQVRQIPGNGVNVTAAKFSGPRLLVPTLGDGLRVYDARTFALAGHLRGHGGLGMQGVAVAPGGRVSVTAGKDNTVVAWNPTNRQAIGQFRGHEDWVSHVALSPNGQLAASSANDRRVIVWHVPTRSRLLVIENQSAIGAPLAFTADGRFLFTTTDMDAVHVHRIAPSQAAAPARYAPRRR